MKKFIILMTSVLLLNSCITGDQKDRIEVDSPEVPELPDLPLGLSNEEYEPLFLYMLDVNFAFKEIYEVLESGSTFTEDSIIRELDFVNSNIDAIKQSLETEEVSK